VLTRFLKISLKIALKIALVTGLLTFVAAMVVSLTTRLPLEAPSARGALEWVGATHVHTVASDGGGTLDEVAEAARVTGLDFVTITDHNLWAMPGPRYIDGSLMVLGEEARVPSGHILVVGGDDPEVRRARRAEAEERGSPLGSSVPAGAGLRIVAHPEGPGEPWRDWDPAGFDALEIWNWDTELRDDGLGDWPKALLLLPAEPVSAMLELLDRPTATIERWDQLLADGHRVPGVCSVDAHSNVPVSGDLALPFPAYRDLFSLARQHVILGAEPTGDADHDAALVTEALRFGRSFCALDGIADASGFSAEAVSLEESTTFGGEISWEAQGSRITASVPDISAPTIVKLYRDGVVVSEGRGPDYDSGALAAPGVYRLEIYVELRRGQVPWIFSNPLWVL
jgi:hypothetical protein